jgi:hypothetical protein
MRGELDVVNSAHFQARWEAHDASTSAQLQLLRLLDIDVPCSHIHTRRPPKPAHLQLLQLLDKLRTAHHLTIALQL